MAQSLSKVYVHLIFSNKNRERTLRDDVRPASTHTSAAICENSIPLALRSTPNPIMPISCSPFPGPTRLAMWSDRQNEAPRHG